jgi:putative transposase
MHAKGYVSVHRLKYKPHCTDSRHGKVVAENILNRNFVATAINQKWVSDFTYIWTKDGWLYLNVIIDLYSRKVIGWAMSASPSAEFVLESLNATIAIRGIPQEVIFHSDRGSQFVSSVVQARLISIGATISMSKKGDCYDNAPAESFFATFKKELISQVGLVSRKAARVHVAIYIESFYNRERFHSALDYLSPVEFELAGSSAGATQAPPIL